MDKSAIRKLYLEKRKALTAEEVDKFSTEIEQNFASLNFDHVKLLHLFYPIPGKHEFNTLLLKKWLNKTHPDITLVLSRSNLKTHTLEHVIWTGETTLAMNEWGITEPVGGNLVRPEELDCILIPLLAFDTNGNRVGYGKGFYDRFLTECRPDSLKAGVSFFEPLFEPIETNSFDIPLDICITPNKIWKFNSECLL